MNKPVSTILTRMLISGIIAASAVSCTKDTNKLGSRGPAGGWIFYDKGAESDGWRYLEAAAEDQSASAKSGCQGTEIDAAKNTAVGGGKVNTAAIIGACKDPNTAAALAAAHRGGGKDDWFLPSKEELVLIQKNLYAKKIGKFDTLGYHSSSIKDKDDYWYVLFENGASSAGKRDYVGGRVRAIRAY